MKKISAIIIAKNEENLIADCMDSVSFCEEIILIDSGSTDRTVQVAEKMGAKVFVHDSINFAELRNTGLRKAAGDLVFYIDADERVDIDLKKEITELKKIDNNIFTKYLIRRKNFYLGNNEWPYIEKMERIFVREKLTKWEGELHEHPVIEGKAKVLDGFLLHYTHRDLTSMLNKTIEWSKIEAELRFKSNHPKMTWWRFPRVMLTAFFNSYVRQKGYRVGTVGLIESIYQSFSMFITYVRLWELQNADKK